MGALQLANKKDNIRNSYQMHRYFGAVTHAEQRHEFPVVMVVRHLARNRHQIKILGSIYSCRIHSLPKAEFTVSLMLRSSEHSGLITA